MNQSEIETKSYHLTVAPEILCGKSDERTISKCWKVQTLSSITACFCFSHRGLRVFLQYADRCHIYTGKFSDMFFYCLSPYLYFSFLGVFSFTFLNLFSVSHNLLCLSSCLSLIHSVWFLSFPLLRPSNLLFNLL